VLGILKFSLFKQGVIPLVRTSILPKAWEFISPRGTSVLWGCLSTKGHSIPFEVRSLATCLAIGATVADKDGLTSKITLSASRCVLSLT